MTQPLTVGDTAPPLSGTINATTTSATAAVHIRRPDGTVINRPTTSLTNNGDGTSGWTLALIVGDLTISGLYAVEVEVTFSDSTIQTFGTDATGHPVTFPVRQEYA